MSVESEAGLPVGFADQAGERQQKAKEKKNRKTQNLKISALDIFIKKMDELSGSDQCKESMYLIKRNSGSFSGWKRVVAAIVFDHSGHALLLQQEWSA